jgi:hypothetical protein
MRPLALLACLAAPALAQYDPGSEVILYANKVGPFANPNEVYGFYSLPFCAPAELETKREDLGPLLKGDRPTKTLYDIRFREDVHKRSLCKLSLDAAESAKFKSAIADDYYFEMMLDELPIWGYVGELETRSANFARAAQDNSTRYFLFTHLDFSIAWNGKHVIEVNVSADPLKRVDLSRPGSHKVDFSYSVRWIATDVKHDERMNRYAQYSFLPQSFVIPWLSIINSFVLVLLLTGFLAIILMRVLKNDFSRYTRDVEAIEEDEEETGWKLVHGDVFRLPANISAFCALVGTGAQLFSLVLFMLVLAIMNMFYPGNRGAMYTAAIVLYATTAGTAGYVSAHLYCRVSGSESSMWAWNLVLTATLFPGPMFVMFAFLNTVAIAYNSQAALPFGTIVVILVIWALVTLPLTIIGGIVGRNTAKGKDAGWPCRTNKIPREIPPAPWYRQGPCQAHACSPSPPRHAPACAAARRSSGPPARRAGVHGGLPAVQRDLHRAALHLRLRVGPQAVHAVRHPLHRLLDAGDRHVVHHDRAQLLPARDRGPPVVVALLLLGRLHRLLRLHLLLLLLLWPLGHVRLHADGAPTPPARQPASLRLPRACPHTQIRSRRAVVLLRVHARRLVRGVHHARDDRLR